MLLHISYTHQGTPFHEDDEALLSELIKIIDIGYDFEYVSHITEEQRPLIESILHKYSNHWFIQ